MSRFSCFCQIVLIFEMLLSLGFWRLMCYWSCFNVWMYLFHVLIAKFIKGQVIKRSRASDIIHSFWIWFWGTLFFYSEFMLLFYSFCIHCFFVMQNSIQIHFLSQSLLLHWLLFIYRFKKRRVAVPCQSGLLKKSHSKLLRLFLSFLLIYYRYLWISSGVFFDLSDIKLLLLLQLFY